MQAEDLNKLKKDLKQLLPEEGMGTVIKALKSHFPPDVPKFNSLLQIESRLNEANLKRVKGILSEDQLQLQYNQLREDLLNFMDSLQVEDFSKEGAKKNKTGSVLYKIPHEMQLQQRSKCIVRLAYEESVIIQNIELTSDTVMQSIRISEAMEVALIDPEGGKNFNIASISSPEQFLEEDDYSEWVFYVTPLSVGKLPLVLKVSVIELIAGKERKKEIVLEEFIQIVTQPVPEEEAGNDFQNAGYSFAFSSASVLDSPEKTPNQKAGGSFTVAATLKKYSMVMAAFAMLLVVSWALGLFEFISWQEAQWKDTQEAYDTFLLKYPDGKFNGLARQHRDLRVAINEKSDSLIVEFLAEYPDSRLKEKAESYYKIISKGKDYLDERVKKRKAEKEKQRGDNEKNKTKGNKDVSNHSKKPEKLGQASTDSSSVSKLNAGSTGQEPANAEPKAEVVSNANSDIGQIIHIKNANNTSNDPFSDDPLPFMLDGVPMNTFPTRERILKELSWLEANMVDIEGGKFKMGCDESKGGCNTANVPQREVKVSSYRLCRYEVTQILWQSVMGYNPSFLDGGRKCDMCPVEYISYMEIQEFVKRLKKRTGKQYRLPTEAEWEYAARGGAAVETTIYAGSNNVNEVAWILSERNKHPQPVGKKKPNSLTLYDMTGNVWEWCEDNWHANYEDAPSKGNAWTKKGFENYRVYRGGSWLDDPDHVRLDFRDMDDVKTRNHILGFRLAEDL